MMIKPIIPTETAEIKQPHLHSRNRHDRLDKQHERA